MLPAAGSLLSRTQPSLSLALRLADGQEPGRKLGREQRSSEIVIAAGFLGNSWKVPEMTFLT